MEKLGQGHLHLKLEIPETHISWSGIEHGSPRWEARTLASYSNNMLIAIWNIYIGACEKVLKTVEKNQLRNVTRIKKKLRNAVWKCVEKNCKYAKKVCPGDKE
jgi:hypothetical protein